MRAPTNQLERGQGLDTEGWAGLRRQEADGIGRDGPKDRNGYEGKREPGEKADQQRSYGFEKRNPGQCHSQQQKKRPVRPQVAQIVQMIGAFPKGIDDPKCH